MGKIVLSYLIVIFFLITSLSLHASEEDYYLDVLQYGTDSDIVKAFSKVHEDLGAIVNAKVIDIFIETHSEKAYLSIVQYIGIAKVKEASNVLIDELIKTGKNDDYREAVIHALSQLKDIRATEHLMRVYEEKRTSTRLKKAIIDAYGRIGDATVEDILIAIASDEYEETDIRARAVLALGELKSKKSIDLLEKLLLNNYEEKIVRMYAASSLSRIGGDSSIDTLSQVIDDETHEVAEYAVNGIAEIGSQRGGDILIDALRSDYDKVRYYAVIGLKKIKYRQAADILRYKAEHDSNELIRKEAEKALEEIFGN
jgi:HEAT repeat protein